MPTPRYKIVREIMAIAVINGHYTLDEARDDLAPSNMLATYATRRAARNDLVRMAEEEARDRHLVLDPRSRDRREGKHDYPGDAVRLVPVCQEVTPGVKRPFMVQLTVKKL